MKNARHFQSAKEPVLNQLGVAPQLLFFFLLVLWLFALVLGVKPAQAFDNQKMVSIEVRNSGYDAGNHYFDLYLRQVGEEKIFLGSSDLVIALAYSPDALQVLNYIPSSTQFFANSGLPVYNYESGISTRIISRNGVYHLIINVFGPSFEDHNFDDDVAAIDVRENLHRLGRFAIPGVSSQFSLAGSSLYIDGIGLKNAIYGYDVNDNFRMSAVVASYKAEAFVASNPVWSFEAQKLSSSVKLNWQLSAEVGVMESQKSFDGKNWEAIAGIAVQQGEVYMVEDLNPVGARVFEGAGLINYRLMVQGDDGKFYYSAVQQLNYQKGISMVTFPNPVVEQLNIRFNDGELSDFQVQIFSSEGQLAGQAFGSRQQQMQLDMSSLPAGQYIVRVLAGAEVGVGRVIVQK